MQARCPRLMKPPGGLAGYKYLRYLSGRARSAGLGRALEGCWGHDSAGKRRQQGGGTGTGTSDQRCTLAADGFSVSTLRGCFCLDFRRGFCFFHLMMSLTRHHLLSSSKPCLESAAIAIISYWTLPSLMLLLFCVSSYRHVSHLPTSPTLCSSIMHPSLPTLHPWGGSCLTSHAR